MRRKIFTITEKSEIEEILHDVEYGILSMCNYDNTPYSIPLNFAYANNTIYFHGAKEGEKLKILKNNNHVSFTVVDAISFIPSYFSANNLACYAVYFFKSVIIKGKIEFINEYNEKIHALSKFMEKFQKEGKYIPFDNEVYKNLIEATLIYKLIPTKISAKFKFGQDLSKERFEEIIKNLKERGTKKDIETIKLMEKYKPF